MTETERMGLKKVSKVRLIDANSLEPDTEWDEYYDGFLSYSQAQIDAAPTIGGYDHTENHWVSTEDRLPDDGSRVLVCNSVGWVDIGVYNGRRGWEINGNYLATNMVKRWQPLPNGKRSV